MIPRWTNKRPRDVSVSSSVLPKYRPASHDNMASALQVLTGLQKSRCDVKMKNRIMSLTYLSQVQFIVHVFRILTLFFFVGTTFYILPDISTRLTIYQVLATSCYGKRCRIYAKRKHVCLLPDKTLPAYTKVDKSMKSTRLYWLSMSAAAVS